MPSETDRTTIRRKKTGDSHTIASRTACVSELASLNSIATPRAAPLARTWRGPSPPRAPSARCGRPPGRPCHRGRRGRRRPRQPRRWKQRTQCSRRIARTMTLSHFQKDFCGLEQHTRFLVARNSHSSRILSGAAVAFQFFGQLRHAARAPDFRELRREACPETRPESTTLVRAWTSTPPSVPPLRVAPGMC